MKYTMQVEVEAEQFLPEEDKIPRGVISDGPRSPRVDKRSAWVIRTTGGMSYISSGDYIITTADGTQYSMNPITFEKMYTPVVEQKIAVKK